MITRMLLPGDRQAFKEWEMSRTWATQSRNEDPQKTKPKRSEAQMCLMGSCELCKVRWEKYRGIDDELRVIAELLSPLLSSSSLRHSKSGNIPFYLRATG